MRSPQVAEAGAADWPRTGIVVMNLSGRGDKDIYTVAQAIGRGCERGRIEARFAELRAEGRAGLVTFLMARRPRPRDLAGAARRACRRPAPT